MRTISLLIWLARISSPVIGGAAGAVAARFKCCMGRDPATVSDKQASVPLLLEPHPNHLTALFAEVGQIIVADGQPLFFQRIQHKSSHGHVRAGGEAGELLSQALS